MATSGIRRARRAADRYKATPYSRLLWLFHALGSNGRLTHDPMGCRRHVRRLAADHTSFRCDRIATVMMKQGVLTEISDQQSSATLPTSRSISPMPTTPSHIAKWSRSSPRRSPGAIPGRHELAFMSGKSSSAPLDGAKRLSRHRADAASISLSIWTRLGPSAHAEIGYARRHCH